MTKIVDVKANLTGVVWQIDAEPGATVAEDDPIVTVESMKMEIPIGAPADGEVVEILVAKDAQVEDGQVVARIRTK